jgi:hypothetical protein
MRMKRAGFTYVFCIYAIIILRRSQLINQLSNVKQTKTLFMYGYLKYCIIDHNLFSNFHFTYL